MTGKLHLDLVAEKMRYYLLLYYLLLRISYVMIYLNRVADHLITKNVITIMLTIILRKTGFSGVGPYIHVPLENKFVPNFTITNVD